MRYKKVWHICSIMYKPFAVFHQSKFAGYMFHAMPTLFAKPYWFVDTLVVKLQHIIFKVLNDTKT